MLSDTEAEEIARTIGEQVNQVAREARAHPETLTGGRNIITSNNAGPSRSVSPIAMSKTIVFLIHYAGGHCAIGHNIRYWTYNQEQEDARPLSYLESEIQAEISHMMGQGHLFYVPYGEEGPAVHFLNTRHIIQVTPYEEQDYIQRHQRNQFQTLTPPRLSI